MHSCPLKFPEMDVAPKENEKQKWLEYVLKELVNHLINSIGENEVSTDWLEKLKMGFQQLLPDGKMEQMTSSQQPPNNHDFVNFRLKTKETLQQEEAKKCIRLFQCKKKPIRKKLKAKRKCIARQRPGFIASLIQSAKLLQKYSAEAAEEEFE